MTAPEPAASLVTRHCHRDPCPEALRWDGTPAAIAVLEAWGAQPHLVTEGLLKGAVRVWGSLHGYAGAVRGDWLVRRPDGEGADKYTPRLFAAAFDDAPPGGDAGGSAAAELAEARAQVGHLSAALAGDNEGVRLWMLDCGRLVGKHRDHAAEVSVRLGDAREVVESFLDQYGGSDIPMFKVGQDLANAVLKRLNAPGPSAAADFNAGRPVAWSDACAPGGMVCAVPDPGRPDGICGRPVESEPCGEHGEAGGDG